MRHCQIFYFVDHDILKNLIRRRISDFETLNLIGKIINGYRNKNLMDKKGLPLGKLILQLFAIIYLDELDKFIKHYLNIKFYLRYTDDFIIIHQDENYLKN